MDDRVATAFERAAHGVGIGDVADHDVDGRVGMGLKIDHAHRGTGGGERAHDVAADEAGSTGDEDAATCEIGVGHTKARG